ncbi:MAG: response regulator [Bacteroidota bacterium]
MQSDSVENSILQMQDNLKHLLTQHKNENWFQQGNIRVAEILNGDKEISAFAKELVLFLAEYLACHGGTFYRANSDEKLTLMYALGTNAETSKEVDSRHSYFAQVINKKTYFLLEDISSTHFNVQASLLKPENGSVIIIPLFYNENLVGIIELAKLGRFSKNEIQFLETNSNPISIYLNTLIAKDKLEDLLDTLDYKEQELQNRISAINKATLMIEFDIDGNVLEVNELFLELTQYTRAEAIGSHHKIFSINPEKYAEEFGDFWTKLRQGQNIKGEFHRKTKNGDSIWLQASYTPVSDKNGKIYKIIKIGYDITLVKNQQSKIEDISLSLSQQVEVLNKTAIVSETDAEGNIIYVNDLFCQISEYPREELIGKNHRMLKSGKQPDGIFVGMWKAIKMGLTWQGEILNLSKNGNYYWVDSTITPFKDKNGKIEKFVAIRFDITKQKESEALKRQTEALLSAQRELEESNTELEAQTQKLQASEEELRVQQEELMQSNKELDEKTKLLEEKNHSFDLKNKELTEASIQLQKKSEELELSSKYKSEFLANMSHELRTPLNSIILLSKLMTDNLEGNLSEDQIEYVTVINKAGGNLLELINDILDLSKIESGKMDINPEQINLANFKKDTEGLFNPISKDKEIEFTIEIDEKCPEVIFTDRMRIDQVIKNFLSNAFKFTAKGKVKLKISSSEKEMISFSVIDNGIGIPKDKQALVFEAFQQADGSTKRKYGGTGLGLSISREIAHLLGGSISLESEPGKGSNFTISVPVNYSEDKVVKSKAAATESAPAQAAPTQTSLAKDSVKEVNLDDDRKSINSGDKTILIVEDDVFLAKAYLSEARSKGFKVLVAMNGNDATILAKKYIPSGIILDINLPHKNGWEVLKEVKDFAETKHIPVHIVSSEDIEKKKGTEAGAVSVTPKPLSSEAMQKVLTSLESLSSEKTGKTFLLSDKDEHRVAMQEFLSETGVEVISVDLNQDLNAQLKGQEIAVIVLDVSSKKTKIAGILETISKDFSGKSISVIVLSSTYLSSVEQKRINNFKDQFNIKIVKSYSDIAEEINLFFNYIVKTDNPKKLIPLVNSAKLLENKKILVVDDDEQNLFSIGKLLETHKAIVVQARNGKEALEIFNSDPSIDTILMDVMMPVMDGYEATREIRNLPKGKNIPIITLTAKSQPDEREKCLKNGSSDFITKPLDADQLIGLIKVWLTNSSK